MADLSVEALLDYQGIVSKTFNNKNEGYEFYNNYALQKGFTVRKCYVERDKMSNEICLRKFVCGRQGFREDKHMKRAYRKRKARDISRCGCLAKMVISCNKETSQWYVKNFIDEHNHALAPPDLACLLRSHRRINKQKAEILEMEVAGVLEMQYGGYDKVGFVSRDVYNFCYRYKMETIGRGDAQTVIRHMEAWQERDPDFFFKYVSDEEGHLKHLFWSDSQSRLDYAAFGDVVVFDSTYRTNRYNLPFVPFVGLDHHRSTIVFGCGIICNETSEAYDWLLQTFLTAMAQKHPISVITDGDLAMQKAIRTILPNCNHRLCTWHIEQNILRNLGNSKIAEEFRVFIYDCCSIPEIEMKWDEFLERNRISSKHSWLYQMYQLRNLWCAAYQVGRCFLGLRSNQRSESLNSKLHTHLDRKMTLFDMLQHYERCLSTIRRNEAQLDATASQSIPFTELDAAKFEKDAARVFTPTVFGLVKEKIGCISNYVFIEILDGGESITYIIAAKNRREWKFSVECEFTESILMKIGCSCCKMERDGLPCGHIMYVLKLRDVEKFPKCCVRRRWTMAAKSAFPSSRKSDMYNSCQTLDRYHELRGLSNEASFIAAQSDESYGFLKHVLKEIVGSSNPFNAQLNHVRYGPDLAQTLPTEVPVLNPVPVKPRGAPKKNKRIEAFEKKPRNVTCGQCKQRGHNRRTCPDLKELESEDEVLE